MLYFYKGGYAGMRRLGKVIALLFVVTFIMQQPVFAYIDPGTGSMLFSIILGACTTLFFILNAIFIKIKTFLFTSKQLAKTSSPFVIYSEGKQYWRVFKPVLDEFEKRKIPLVYYTSAQDDDIFNENYEYIKSEFIGKGNKAYFKLAFLNADVCLMTTPHLDVLQLKRSKNVKHYSHILHAITFSCGYLLYSLDYFDSVLCDADFQIPLIREIEKKRNLAPKELPVTGSTYMDYYAEIKKQLPSRVKEGKTVLIAPSWGKENLLNKIGTDLLDKLAASKYKVIVRPHPQTMIINKNFIDKLMKKYENYTNITWNFDTNNVSALSQADILISDFSGVMFDYAFLFDRPFIYIDTEFNFEATDIADLDEIPYRYQVADIIGTKIKAEKIKNIDIEKTIDEILKDGKFDEIQKAKKHAWQYQGEAAVRVVDFLVQKQKEVNKR